MHSSTPLGPHRSQSKPKASTCPYDVSRAIKHTFSEANILRRCQESDKTQHDAVLLHLEDLRSAMIPYIRKGPCLPVWSPDATGADLEIDDYLRGLQIPLVMGKPNVLLHDLGRFKTDPALAARVNGIFAELQHTFLVNTSGSGKTRLLLEGLCERWGFYFTSVVDGSGLGSSDVQAIIDNYIPDDDDFCQSLPSRDDSNYNSLLHKNRCIAKRAFSQVLLARLHIFKLFLTSVRQLKGDEDVNKPVYKLHWLLLQLLPSIGRHRDVFLELFETIAPTSLRYTTSMIKLQLSEIRDLLPQDEKKPRLDLFCVLDEAQHAAKQHSQSFRSSQERPRPVLREIVGAWTNSDTGQRDLYMVISGTGISKEEVAEVIASAVVKSGVGLISDTGAFETSEEQRNYLLRYLPSELAVSQSGQRLLERSWTWLRGRHRFTATFLNALILNKFRQPHNLLTCYVEHLTKFHPTDTTAYLSAEGPNQESTIFKDIRGLDVEFVRQRHRFSDTQMAVLYKMVNDCYMLRYITGISGMDDIAFVDSGVARFVDLTASKITFDEPLVILAVLKWLDEDYQSTYRFWAARTSSHSPDYNGFEGMLALCFSFMFGSQRRLDEIFTFHGCIPSWASQKARLVTINRSEANGWAAEINEVDSIRRRGPSANLGLHAESPLTVHDWLSHLLAIPICFPVAGMGPDLLFVLQLSDESLIWVAVQSKHQQSFGSGDLTHAIRSVTPSRFYVQASGAHHCKSAFPSLVAATREALLQLPHRRDDAGQYGLLRVIASFPAEATSSSYVTADCDTGGHPLASLNFDVVKSMTKDMSPLGFWATPNQGGYSRLSRSRAGYRVPNSPPQGDDLALRPHEALGSPSEVQTPLLVQSEPVSLSTNHQQELHSSESGDPNGHVTQLPPQPSQPAYRRTRWSDYELAGALG